MSAEPFPVNTTGQVDSKADSTQPIVLIVDDDPDYRTLIRYHFEKLGWRILDTGVATQISEILSHQAVDLMILDIVMPNVEGLETVRHVRRNHASTKILAVSGADRASNYLSLATLLGASAVLEKGAGTERLMQLAQSLIEGADKEPGVSRKARRTEHG